MEVLIRFLSGNPKLSKTYTPFSLPDGVTVEALLHEIERAGAAGLFCSKDDWEALHDHVLVAADGRMLQHDEPISAGQHISIIGQLIGG